MELDIYVDGSYNSNNHTYGGGLVVLVPNINTPLMHKVAGNNNNAARLRNVAGELLAAITAVNLAKQVNCTKLRIYHDFDGTSRFVLKEEEARRRFSKEYRSFMLEAMKTLQIEFVKVEAHAGNEYNELAHCLARDAAREGVTNA